MGSILDVPTVTRLVHECDAIYHVAAVVGMKHVVEHPLLTFRTNMQGTQTVLDAAAAQRKRVLLTSTSEVYGLSADVPAGENALAVLGSTAKSRWSYAFSKAACEVLALSYAREERAPFIVTRLFNTVGPRQSGRYGMVIPRFVRQALSGMPLTVFGDGSQTRSFAHVREIASALINLMHRADAAGQIVNVGNPREVRILDLAQRVLDLTGSSSRIVFVPYDVAYEPGFEDIMRRVPDISKLRELIDFEPRVQMDSILRDVIAEQKQRVVAV
jgi:UDP-glucose 4-epimerase